MAALGHVWTAPWQELSDVFAAFPAAGIDSDHCPAFGDRGALYRRRRSAMPNNGDGPSDCQNADATQDSKLPDHLTSFIGRFRFHHCITRTLQLSDLREHKFQPSKQTLDLGQRVCREWLIESSPQFGQTTASVPKQGL
jgi:hypothetical protein